MEERIPAVTSRYIRECLPDEAKKINMNRSQKSISDSENCGTVPQNESINNTDEDYEENTENDIDFPEEGSTFNKQAHKIEDLSDLEKFRKEKGTIEQTHSTNEVVVNEWAYNNNNISNNERVEDDDIKTDNIEDVKKFYRAKVKFLEDKIYSLKTKIVKGKRDIEVGQKILPVKYEFHYETEILEVLEVDEPKARKMMNNL
jgi:hypothetical protein